MITIAIGVGFDVVSLAGIIMNPSAPPNTTTPDAIPAYIQVFDGAVLGAGGADPAGMGVRPANDSTFSGISDIGDGVCRAGGGFVAAAGGVSARGVVASIVDCFRIDHSSFARSPGVWNRSSGFFAIAFATIADSSGETPLRTSAIGVAVSLACAFSTSTSSLPRNGGTPARR